MRDVPSILAGLAPIPDADFAEFGDVEVAALSKIQQLTGAFLGRNWVTIPHVTHHDEVDVTEVEARRIAWNAANPSSKVTPVALVVCGMARALAEHPKFNSSLGADGKTIVQKRYINIGVAVDTPKGLLVPVLKGVDGKSLVEIAGELAATAEKARNRGLPMSEMSGGSMTLSSLGHIGGTAFTPIINAPEVAVLGALAIQQRPGPGIDGGIEWRKMLPLSLSYDHRVINGADAARFVRSVGAAMANPALFG
ncbi:2-oxo acid dehydrogenase subunit E2 [Sphingomonas aliaeris]|uniref:Dihydrolipoyllysine-residue acetyltransferase component of pyruvate dehydrogenase complex n=1 Tax=Sphingomonas aliaeris TaxID=2759526 RepID=A0A974S4L8_9SPHN|nr:2-oxo acid dehydrogenase subunit E2 [Sphingomonas aliaeris]QQV77666.1 2-oxo acid dehydrogenase subunit E2 [Sphingomonas aliaeris]